MGNQQVTTQGATQIFQEHDKPELYSLDVYSVPESPHPRLVCQTAHNLWELTIRDASTGLSIPGSERWRGKQNWSQYPRVFTPPGGLGVRILLSRSYSLSLIDGASFEQLAKAGGDEEHRGDGGPGRFLGIYIDPASGTPEVVTVSGSLALSVCRMSLSYRWCPCHASPEGSPASDRPG
jgi:hypothetical protein